MPSTSAARGSLRAQHGFTLVELAIVILIVGVLAAIALPTFLNQRARGQDSLAKTHVRSLLTIVESCYAVTSDYTGCDSKAELDAVVNQPLGIEYGSGPDQAEMVSATADGFTLRGHSRSGTAFEVERPPGDPAAPVVRTCSNAGSGGCPDSGVW